MLTGKQGFGLYTYKALISGRNFNILALACICATFVAIDGPLLQRASTVRLMTPQQSQTLQVSITPQLLSYWSGVADFSLLPEVAPLDFQRHFISLFEEWAHDEPIRGGITGCTGTCKATVRAPAFVVDHCVHNITHRDFRKPVSNTTYQDFLSGCVITNQDILTFANRFNVNNGTHEYMNYTTVLSDEGVTKTCNGKVNETTCSLLSGTAEYEVLVTGGVITFQHPHTHPKIVSIANNTAITQSTVSDFGLTKFGTLVKTTLGGIANGANVLYYRKQDLIAYPGATQSDSPIFYPALDRYTFQHMTNYADMFGPDPDCGPAWTDPRDGVMVSL